MTVKECPNFNPEFPELFPWGQIDSVNLDHITREIISHLKNELEKPTEERYLTPGLRKSLNLIAEFARI